MDEQTDRFYPSAQLENNDIEQTLEKKLNDVNISNNSINNFKGMITHFKYKSN